MWSIANLSDATASDRLDAEYFDPTILELIRRLKEDGGPALIDVCHILNGRTPEFYSIDGTVPVIRSGDLDAPLIYPSFGRNLLKTFGFPGLVRLQQADVLISSIGMGSIGKISIVLDPGHFATVSEVTILRPHSYPSEVIFAYLRTDSGQKQIIREITGATGQQHLLKSKVEKLIIPPVPTPRVCEEIRAAVENAWKLEIETAAAHRRIAKCLAHSLGLPDEST